ncbi:hypothetical protein GCM10010495_77440 [Kitasatospora herbaricolor]|uniref:DUF4328 domain-containing protein n=1 Tax=Kitasatospora herbaricolor TaxID=68217 RepID=UPI00174854E6|nr:DUF4328 domain-containing protein [Kitasatospora herbaricolor]MDQ0305536.1 hypothetical protein [Kitasatospora herbaricolor]GGV48205.1 hypothetical protein GCM10010495_77440 [Kitasatospora herbaricolor]
MNSEAGRNVPRPRALAYSGPVADPRRLALAAQVLIAVQTAAQLTVAVAGGTRSKFFAQFVPISMPLFLATIIVFLCWFRRCRLNAELFAPGTHKYSAGLAVGAWFIPGAMWWIPRRVALDIWRANSPTGGAWLINAWWVAWLAKTVGGAVAVRLGARPYGYSLYDEVVGVVAAALAILVIQQVTARQDAKVRVDLKSLPFTQTSSL